MQGTINAAGAAHRDGTRTADASSTKRHRRTRQELDSLDTLIYETVEEHRPCTVRQVFYLVTSQGGVEKTEKGYGLVQRRLMAMRTTERMPWFWLADNTRWRSGVSTYLSAADCVRTMVDGFYLDIQAYQDTRLEVWAEKDAITGVLSPITRKYRIDLMPCRGFPSFTFLMGASDAANEDHRPFKILYLGDHDPSGAIIDVIVRRHMERHYQGTFLGVERIAVDSKQIEEFGLQTRPTKKSDSRAKNFEGDSVEVDAIPPQSLRNLLEAAIRRHIEPRAMEMALRIEERERQTLKAFAEGLAS
jgi:hypothetical protein